MSTDFWNMSCVMMVLGLVFVLGGVILNGYAARQRRYRGHAEAKVVDIITEPRSDAFALSQFRNRQLAVFEFYADGRPVKVKDKGDPYPSPYKMNQKIQILYNPENPQEYCVAKRDRWKLLASCLNTAGVLCIVCGCILFLMYAARIEL